MHSSESLFIILIRHRFFKRLFRIADRMMYQSKSTKNKVTVCFLDGQEDDADNA